jgi:glycosyltransferase involved in cell wall biosynthesis
MAAIKNIVIINDFGHINGGAAQVAINTALGLSKLGHRIHYFYAVAPLDQRIEEDPNIEAICTHQDDILNTNSRFLSGFQGLWNRKSARIFAESLASLSPEDTVIHVHGWIKALSHSVLKVAINKGFPIAVTLHDYFSACPNGGFYNYPKQEICPLRGLSGQCILSNCDSRNYAHKLWRILRGYIQKYIAKFPAKVRHYIALSHQSHDILASYLPGDAIVYHLPSPVTAERGPRVKAEENDYLVGLGRFSPEKGFGLLAQASNTLEKKVMFIGAGDMEEELRDQNPSAVFTGWLSADEIQEKMREARVLVFPSKSYETQGLVVSEAASYGIPAIVSDISVASELIEENVNGVLFKSDDLDDLISKIDLFDDNAFTKELSQNAYDKFWANYRPEEEYFKSILSIYEQVLNGKKDDKT